jgi:hypothetical protein
MYIKTIRLFIILCTAFLAGVVQAAQLLATVSDTKVQVGQSIQLNLSLKDAKAKNPPDFTRLSRDFRIYSQQQYSTYTSTNGVISSEAGWDITLIPLHEGELVIPSIQILSDNGLLSSPELRVVVLPAAKYNSSSGQTNSRQQDTAATDNADDGIGISLLASTNKTTAYVKEPIIYTLKIIGHRPFMNVALEDIKSNDATIDKIGEPKQYSQIINGRPAHVIELKYYVTPVSPGKIVITPAEIRGEIQAPTLQTPTHRSFLNNFLLNDAMHFKPFSMRGDVITLNALKPATQDGDWLPLQNLAITEEWSGLENPKVGDTIVRKIKLIAKGGFSNQLPGLQSYNELSGVKTYADKPIYSDNLATNADQLVASKEETFTLIATQPGNITLPQISIPWWNLQSSKLDYARLPAKTINILPAATASSSDSLIDYSTQTSESSKPVSLIDILQQNLVVFVLIAGLLLVILSLFAIIIYLLRRHSNNRVTNVLINNNKATKLNPLDTPINTVVELRDHILFVAQQSWQAPPDLTLNKLGTFLTENNYSYDIEVYLLLCNQINAALYANNIVSLSPLLDAWQQLRASIIKNKQKVVTKKSDYINLNPT